MEVSDQAELEIVVEGPQGLGVVFWTQPIEGLEVQEFLRRSMPTYDDLHHLFLLVRDGAIAAAAVLKVVDQLKKLLGKHPGLKDRIRIRVRFGARIAETDISRLREIGCEVEFVREPAVQFDAGPALPPRIKVPADK